MFLSSFKRGFYRQSHRLQKKRGGGERRRRVVGAEGRRRSRLSRRSRPPVGGPTWASLPLEGQRRSISE